MLWLVLLFVVSLAAVTSRIYASDEIQYFAFLRSLWFDHDLSFENEYRYFYDHGIARSAGFHETFLERTTETGLRINFGTIGSALLWAPFYALADIVARASKAFGRAVDIDGFSQLYIAAVCYGSALYGFLAVLLSRAAANRLVAESGPAALAIWLGTPLAFYMYIAAPMAHACSAFVVSAFVLTWLIVRERWSTRGVIALGGLAALMAMVREQDAFFVVGPAVDFIWTVGRRWRDQGEATGVPVPRLMWSAAAGVAAFALVYLPQAISYIVLNGRIGPSGLVARKMNWMAPYGWRVLASVEHGLFFWTPMAALAVIGLGCLVYHRPPTGAVASGPAAARGRGRGDQVIVGACFLIMLALQVYAAGSVESWTVAGAFGQRRFVGSSVVLTIGLAALWNAVRPGPLRVALKIAVVLCVWWNVGLMAQFGGGLMDRQRLDLGRNAYNTFVVVPLRLPELTYRYLFDRSSFYQTAAE